MKAIEEGWYRSACFTHQGRRDTNEDAVVIGQLPGGGEVMALADGMGGHAAGDLASATALDTLVQELRAGAELSQAVRNANSAVHETAARVSGSRGMGTTLVAVVRRGGTYHIANVGDSRAYRVDGAGIQQISHDHSFVAEAVRLGGLSPEEAARSPWRNTLTRSLGTSAEVEPDMFGPFASPGVPHLVLLCSDGVYKVLSNAAVWHIILSAEDASAAAGMLSAAAYQRGSSDNITAAVMEFGRVFQPQDHPTEPLEEQVRRGAVRHSHSSPVFSRR